jgi:hypothetical protein
VNISRIILWACTLKRIDSAWGAIFSVCAEGYETSDLVQYGVYCNNTHFRFCSLLYDSVVIVLSSLGSFLFVEIWICHCGDCGNCYWAAYGTGLVGKERAWRENFCLDLIVEYRQSALKNRAAGYYETPFLSVTIPGIKFHRKAFVNQHFNYAGISHQRSVVAHNID